jgi:hypothetical protein
MVELQSTITCPRCGYAVAETMLPAACQILYTCKRCGLELRPTEGDCCVFCSYGSVPCPPIQEARRGAAEATSSCACGP